jgi:hypothetical protein
MNSVTVTVDIGPPGVNGTSAGGSRVARFPHSDRTVTHATGG